MIAQSQSEPLLAQQKILGTNPQTAGKMEALYAARSGDLKNTGQIENRLIEMARQLDPSVGSYDEAASKLIAMGRNKQSDITKTLVEEASPLYERSLTQQIPAESEALNQPFVQDLIKKLRANTLYKSEFNGVPDNSIQVVDAVKKEIDAMIRSPSVNRNEARLMANYRDALVREADQAVPTYAQAREVYSGNPDLLRMRDRIGNLADLDEDSMKQVVSKLFSGTQRNADTTAQALSSPAFNQVGPQNPRTAAAARIYEAMDTARGDPTSLANKIAPDARTADMLRSYVGGNQLDETLNVINQAKIGDKFRYGSPTQPLQEAQRSLEQGSNMAGDAVDAALNVKTGGITGAIKGIAKMIGKSDNDPQFYEDLYQIFTTPRGLELMEQISNGQNQEIAKQLQTTGGRELIKAVIGIPSSNALNANPVANSLISGINAPSSYQSTDQVPVEMERQQTLPAGFVVRQGSLPPGFVIRQ
jgi:hypothetical protein